MKAVLTSLGSLGDIQPILALAVEMVKSGHDVQLCLSPNYSSHVQALGMQFVPIGPPMQAAEVRSVIAEQTSMSGSADQARLFVQSIAPHVGRMYRELREISRNADALIATPHQVAARMVHDAIDIPFVTVHLAHFGALGAPDLKNATAPIINAARQAEGLEPLDDPLTRDAASPLLALYAVTSRILKRPRQWPDHHHVTGYFFLDNDAWTPPGELVDFLAGGPKPVVVSFSSMMHADTNRVGDVLLSAIEQTKQRAVILDGWSGLTRDRRLPADGLGLTGFVPHRWLFPRASCVIHHGGAGTTAAAFRAGVPAVVVPHTLDQPIWAEFARALKCAGAVIPLQQLTSDGLADAINVTLQNPALKAAAERMAVDIAAESGVETARSLIEDLITSGTCRGKIAI
jgi:sterol 3beta-glucosyltransferase